MRTHHIKTTPVFSVHPWRSCWTANPFTATQGHLSGSSCGSGSEIIFSDSTQNPLRIQSVSHGDFTSGAVCSGCNKLLVNDFNFHVHTAVLRNRNQNCALHQTLVMSCCSEPVDHLCLPSVLKRHHT